MTVFEVIVSDDAKADLENGKAFYDSRLEGIGDYFIDCLISDIESLCIFAGIHSMQFGYYRMLSKRFPYAIYYDVDAKIASVTAIIDMRRNPAHIRKQLGNRKGYI